MVTATGSAESTVEINAMMAKGHVSLPNGMGLSEGETPFGTAPNELTSNADRDWIAGTPWHKSVPVRLEHVGA